ncbi:MAG: DNA recombination protein RmuC [Patescibacteria group bacterium]|nr:MAG: DNA recombination protein RmuC [Patescibacteria group bacterium]
MPIWDILTFLAVTIIGVIIMLQKRQPHQNSHEAILQQILSIQNELKLNLREENSLLRREYNDNAKSSREELAQALKNTNDSLLKQLQMLNELNKSNSEGLISQLTKMIQLNEQKLEHVRETVETRLRHLQADNETKLEQMRATVDEKLHATLEKRLGESFKLVSDRLETVHQGLGEMRNLASGVSDLKKVLTNVKTRGTWGEVQLAALLSQMLTPDQYAANVATKQGSLDRVEFVIKLPGKDSQNSVVYIPIDAKFPQEDYHRLLEASEAADPQALEQALKGLENRIKLEGKTIRDKYLDPPHTTDFAIMYLPTEGLYAEVIRNTALCEYLQRECRVVITGPTTLTAILNALQMGFRTLAIEKTLI